jgi:hypothetical protein
LESLLLHCQNCRLQQNISWGKPFGNRTESTFSIVGKDFAILRHVSLCVIFHARLNVNESLCIKCGKKTQVFTRRIFFSYRIDNNTLALPVLCFIQPWQNLATARWYLEVTIEEGYLKYMWSGCGIFLCFSYSK